MVIYEKSTCKLIIPEGIQEGQYTEEDIKQAYQDGYNDGNDEGYQDGYADGLDDGFDEGYQSGYTDGVETCQGEYGKELTFEIQSDGDIKWWATYSSITRTIEYKKNDGEWTSITSTTGGTTIPVVSGDTVQFRGDNSSYSDFPEKSGFYSNCQFKLRGNIMSLIDSTDFTNLDTLTDNNTFSGMFDGCTGLTDVSKLVLPATTLTQRCYDGMFQGCSSLTDASGLILPATTLADSCYYAMFNRCTSLVNAPDLPATTLAQGCYYFMFANCTSLTTAPVLPATTLAQSCYDNMFRGCTSLVNAPALPATTLARQCYSQMFADCTSLSYIKCLATDISAPGCTQYWVNGVAENGTFVKNPNMTDWTTGIDGIPENWTVQDAS